MEQAIQALTKVTGELVRENRALVQGLAADRGVFRETLRELSGFVATAGIALERLERQIERLEQQVSRLVDMVAAGFARLESAMGENNRLILDNNHLILDNNHLILDNNRMIVESNRLIADNNTVIRWLLDILARGRGDGGGLPETA